MAKPTTRAEFKEHCLRRLGKPTIQIEVTDEQVDDRVTEALEYYKDYHFDATVKQYFKHKVEANNRPGKIYEVEIANSGTGYANTDSVVFTGVGNNAAASITTDANGSIVSTSVTNIGNNYVITPTVTVTSNTGSGASLRAVTGGFIPVPENIIGAVHVYPVGQALGTNDIFNIRYQIALNDLYTLTSASLVPFYSAFQHIELIEELLVGKQPMRFNRHQNRIYLDMEWTVVPDNSYLMVEAYEVLDPDEYTDIWSDRWLTQYTTALIKRQWGFHLTKHTGMMMPGGLQYNGEKILDDAQAEILRLEEEMLRTYSIPACMFVG